MIIIRTEYIPGGFFAQIINRVFQILLKFEEYNIYPYFEIHSDLYGLGDNKEIIPYYFVHNYNYNTNNDVQFNPILLDTFNHTIENDNIVLNFIDITKKWNSVPRTLIEANKLFFKYFDFSLNIKNEFNKLYKELFIDDNILGFHYRGTDKMGPEVRIAYSESFYINFDTTLEILKKELKRLNTNKMFVAADDSKILTLLQDNIPNLQIITVTHDYETTSGIPLHKNPKNNNANKSTKYKIGSSAIIDSLLLSKCKCLIKYASHLSAYSILFNPNLEAYRLNKCNYSWFPENRIKDYIN